MSADIVDDLQGAEELVGILTTALEEILTGGPFVAVNDAMRAMNDGQHYCRATCQADDTGHHTWSNLDGDCDCPCHEKELK